MRTMTRIDRRRRPGGFTLIELGAVTMIIGLMASFILIVSLEGIESAKERATQGLITKLDSGMADLITRLQAQQVRANLAHQWLAYPESLPLTTLPPPSPRAEVIARIDFIKAEMPDVFFLQVDPSTLSSSSVVYPLNFAAVPYTLGNTPTPISPPAPHFPYVLPFGNSVGYDRVNPSPSSVGAVPYSGNPVQFAAPPGYSPTGTGIYGASYSVAAGLLKNLGTASREQINMDPVPYLPTGYDGVDNNGNGLVDDWAEGVNSANIAPVIACLNNHRHSSARAEMLYALLIESPGAVMSRDDFKASEIADTDGDGMPEFVDAWGNPVQFFRWPTHYHSNFQRGINPEGFDGLDNNGNGVTDYDGTSGSDFSEATVYRNVGENRETNPLDPNNTLLSPAWWSGPTLQFPGDKALAFQQRYFSLVEPLASRTPIDAPAGYRWDRGGFFKRRNFYCKYLIMSVGRDGEPGVPLLPEAWVQTARTSPSNATQIASDLVLVENRAASVDMNLGSPLYTLGNLNFDSLRQMPGDKPGETLRLIAAGQDDVTSQNLRVSGAATR